MIYCKITENKINKKFFLLGIGSQNFVNVAWFPVPRQTIINSNALKIFVSSGSYGLQILRHHVIMLQCGDRILNRVPQKLLF